MQDAQYPDFTEDFNTSRVFSDRDELLKYVHEIATRRNNTLSIACSRNRNGNKLGYANIGCQFRGKYRPNKSKNERMSFTKRIVCQFLLNAKERLDEVCEGNKSNVQPNDILTMLKRKDAKNASMQMHIQNSLIQFRKEEREGKSPL
ncbi:hypothetical protein LIER_15486 [Lithospermum erythrorhizon]|uniref:FAR1 domain-containing protein n=1 Tax=Lithospermum erythrorhizon TaxID=34254 RepID=A0AAV3Q4Q8_LITER